MLIEFFINRKYVGCISIESKKWHLNIDKFSIGELDFSYDEPEAHTIYSHFFILLHVSEIKYLIEI